MLHSLGIYFMLLSLVRFLEFNPGFYMLVLAIKGSLIRVGQFIITIAPLFLAYTMVVCDGWSRKQGIKSTK